jgi:hypothetical protein
LTHASIGSARRCGAVVLGQLLGDDSIVLFEIEIEL